MLILRSLITPALTLTAAGWSAIFCHADALTVTVLHTFSRERNNLPGLVSSGKTSVSFPPAIHLHL